MFGDEPCAGGVVGAKYFDIDEAWEVTIWVLVLLVWTEIVFVTAWLGWMCVHAAYDENGV